MSGASLTRVVLLLHQLAQRALQLGVEVAKGIHLRPDGGGRGGHISGPQASTAGAGARECALQACSSKQAVHTGKLHGCCPAQIQPQQ